MIDTYNPHSEIITHAEVFYLFALIVTFKDGYKCVFDISDLVSEHIIHQPFRDNPLFFYDFVVHEDGYKIDWNIDFASDNIREHSVPFDDILKYIKEQSRNRMMAADQSDPFAKEKARNRRKTQKLTPFLADPLGQSLTKAILKAEVLAPYVLKLTYKDGYKCLFDYDEFMSNASLQPQPQDTPNEFSNPKLDSWGTNMLLGQLELNAESIREYSVPLEQVTQWIREETRRIRNEVQNKHRPK